MAGFGFRLARSQGMEGFSGSLNEFDISASDTTAIYSGDPVILSGGYATRASSGAAAIAGIFDGCRYVDSDGSYVFKRHWDGVAGRTNIVASVIIPTSGMFHVKGKTAVSFAQATSVGAAHPFELVAGSSTYGDSRIHLLGPAAGPVIVHRLVDIPGNAWGTGEPILECSINLQAETFSSAS